MLTDFYFPTFSGIARVVELLSKELARKGHTVIVCTTSPQASFMNFGSGSVRVIPIEGLFYKLPMLYKDKEKRYPPPIMDPLVCRQLDAIIKKEKPDIVHSHGWLIHSFLPLKKKFNLPLIATLHGYELFCPKKSLFDYEGKICDKPFTSRCLKCSAQLSGYAKAFSTYFSLKLGKRKIRLVDKYIAVSSFVKQVHIKNLPIRDKDIVVIPNFYESQNNKKISHKNKSLPDDFILFVGALSIHKGVDILINAFNRINPATNLVIIGSREADYSYKSTKKITVIENASNSLVNEAYSKCRFVVVPSIFSDPFPTVALEAMNSKKAIIGSSVGGLSEMIVTGNTGLLVPPNDCNELANAMRSLLLDPKKTEQFGLNGYDRFVKKFAPIIVVSKVEALYKKVLRHYSS
jgi:glycosyltransferase involved in cell wall biosynthesis